MFNSRKIAGVIIARGGSEGLPGKNIRDLAGKPLVVWTVEQAMASRYIDEIVLSTDSEEIASAAEMAGLKVPFIRPKELATSQTHSEDVINHAVDTISRLKNTEYDIVIKLQPTSPLRKTEDIDLSIELLFEKKARSIVSVYKTNHTPAFQNTLPENGCMKDFLKKSDLKNRQEFDDVYALNGVVYTAFIDYFKEQWGFFGPQTYAYIMPIERSVDVDNLFEFEIADYLKRKELSVKMDS